MHPGGLYDDVSILDELPNIRPRVGIADLGLLVGVEPDFALADAGDGCGEPLLRAKVDHRRVSAAKMQRVSAGAAKAISEGPDLVLEELRSMRS